jgi:AraC-like DNA-binding protein
VSSTTRVLVAEAVATRLGQLHLAGEVLDTFPRVPRSPRVIDAYVLSVLVDGQGSFVFPDGHEAPIGPGTPSVVLPGQPHWYGTREGGRWTELFAAFTGPLFDTLADVGVLTVTGPLPRQPASSIRALRSLLGTAPRAPRAAEHQLFALAEWLLDAANPPSGTGLTPTIAAAVDRLSENLELALDMSEVAAALDLPYNTFRRRFAAEVGESPGAFRNTRRLETGATLLRLTNMTVRQVARAVGYTDEFHFSRRFRAQFGVPPRTYGRSLGPP